MEAKINSIVDITNKLLISCRAQDVEIEARIRKQLVNDESCDRLIRDLGIEWDETEYMETRRISKTNRKCAYRQRDNDIICKSSIAREELNDVWCTINVSTEVQALSMYGYLRGAQPVSVRRLRGVIDGHYVDVIYDDGHRVEVEVCNVANFDPYATINVVKRVCTVLQGSKEYVGYYDWFTVVHVTKTAFDKFCIDLGRYQKPRTMTMDAMREVAKIDDWAVTPKVDGVRRFIIAIDDRVFSVGLAKDVKLEGTSKNVGIFVMDCEYTDDDMYHVFDLVVCNGEYFGDRDGVFERLDKVEKLRMSMSEELSKRISIKEHHRYSSFDALCKLYEDFRTNRPYKIDGIIFVNTARGYMQQVPKWKPYSTVDLMVTQGQNGNITLLTCDDYIVDIPVRYSRPLPGTLFQSGLDGNRAGSEIWEFSYDNELLTPQRPRHDKPQANSKNIVEINIYYSVPGTVFSGRGCYLMRKYHNKVKKQLIAASNDKGAIILDIGTGQGGDVNKWNRAAEVYCIEPNRLSTLDMIDRHGNTKNIYIINTHLRDLDIDTVKKKINIFTAFFCMNQFEKGDWNKLQDLISRKGSSKCRLLVIAMTAPKAHKGECFELKEIGDGYNITIHGTRILNINETTVRQNSLTKAMKECGMELLKQERLNTDLFMTKEERRLSSMYEVLVYKKHT